MIDNRVTHTAWREHRTGGYAVFILYYISFLFFRDLHDTSAGDPGSYESTVITPGPGPRGTPPVRFCVYPWTSIIIIHIIRRTYV